MLIREGKQICNTEEKTKLVFSSINQAKLYNRTKLDGKAINGKIQTKDFATVETVKHVAK